MKRPHHMAMTASSPAPLPFSPMEQMEELTPDVAATASNFGPGILQSDLVLLARMGRPTTDSLSTEAATATNGVGYGGEGLEEALGINFHDSSSGGGGVVQRELVAK